MIPIPKSLTEGTDCYRLFEALRSGQPKSHHELYALHMIVHSRASDLRLKHGCLIDTWRDGKTTWYQLRSVRTVREGEVATDGGPDSASPSRTVFGTTVCPDRSADDRASTGGPGQDLSPGGPAPLQLTVWGEAA